ncbi:MAG: metal-dependent hydrolase [Candidatus Magnetobacterium sp. LHC-1]
MTGKTHATAGALAGIVFSKYTNEPMVMMTIFSVLGGLLPDIDSPESIISTILFPIAKPWAIARKFFKKHKFKMLGDMFEHRGITHSLLPILPLLIWRNIIVLGLIVGILSHIAIDMLNDRGVPLLYPITTKRVHVLTITTGNWTENVFYGLLCIGTAIEFIGVDRIMMIWKG